MTQLSFISIGQGKKTLRCEKFLTEMNNVVPWKRLSKVVKPYYHKSKMGRPPMPIQLMLKIYCLQQWYQLSDPSMEEAIYDRVSFQKFLNVDLLSDVVPDETTILNFRHLLEKNNLQDKIFNKINHDLEEKGLLMKKGTIVDATLINSPKSTKNADKARDPEMSSTKKNNQWYFGMKAHIGVDCKSGLVHSVEGTTAKDHDRTCLPDLLHNQEEIVIGDKGYYSEEDKYLARQAGVHWAVLDRKKRGRKLSRKQKKRNAHISLIRSKVEHPFQIIKCKWGYVKTRYKGIQKNLSQLKMLFGLHNLYKVRNHSSFQVG